MGIPALSRAAFLDRDGIVNELVFYPDTGEHESPRRAADLRMIEAAFPAWRRLKEAGFRLVIVSNQPSFAKGKTSREDLVEAGLRVERELSAAGAGVDASYYCYHHPLGTAPGFSGECACRKPRPGLLLRAGGELGLDLARCWMIGDQDSDMECGRSAGCRTALVEGAGSEGKRGRSCPDVFARSAVEAVEMLLAAGEGE
jgi:D-glycero-D-manno-heptose 1,7-bisphosphate phosphatase